MIVKRNLTHVLARLGVRTQNLAYLLENPIYRAVRKNGGSRDLFKLLNKPWLAKQRIQTVIDVGANEGQFAKTVRVLLPQAFIYAFEPNPRAVENLERHLAGGKMKIFSVACGKAAGTCQLHLSHFAPASSLLEATSKQLAEFPETARESSISVPVRRIDAVMLKEDFAPGALLKIDVQGLELPVLEGASGILGQVEVIVCEINLAQLYSGQSELEGIIGFLRQHQFRLVDLAEPIRARESEEILYLDMAFLRSS